MLIESLEIDDHILDKIESKHGVTFDEAEEVCLSDNKHVRRSLDGLYKVFSKTPAGRYLLVVLVQLESARRKIVTARDMNDSEIKYIARCLGGSYGRYKKSSGEN